MTSESLVSAFPEDLFGPRGKFLRDVPKVEKLFLIAKSIDAVQDLASDRNWCVTQIYGSGYVLHSRKEQTLDEAEFSIFVDRINGYVWVTDIEVEKFVEIFGPDVLLKASN